MSRSPLHEGSLVTAGQKRIVRTDVLYTLPGSGPLAGVAVGAESAPPNAFALDDDPRAFLAQRSMVGERVQMVFGIQRLKRIGGVGVGKLGHGRCR